MDFRRPQFFIPLLLVMAALGFAVGALAQAGGLGEPGSAEDPLVSVSYVQEAVNQNLGELQQQVMGLQDRIDELRARLDRLEGNAGPAREAQSVTGGKEVAQTGGNSSGAVAEKASSGVIAPEMGANVRTGPATEFDKVAALAKGAQVEIIAEKDGWLEVKLSDGRKGWVLGELVDR